MRSSIVCPSPLANVLVDLLVLWPHVAEHSPAQTIPVASAHEIGCSKHTLNMSCRKGLIFPTFFSMNPLIPLHATFMSNWDGPNLMTIGSSDIHLRRLGCYTLLCALKEVVRNKNLPWIAAQFALKLQKHILRHGYTPILSALSVTTSLARHTPLRLRWAAAPPRGWTSAGRRRSSRYTPAGEIC